MIYRSALTSFVLAMSLIALSLSGCKDSSAPADGNSASTTSVIDLDSAETVPVKATSHIFPDEPIIKASIAPKSGMRAFSSKILLLSSSGRVYATDTAFPKVKPVQTADASDITGFYLSDNSSGFLILDQSGNTEVYMDGGPGGFKKVPQTGLPDGATFCEAIIQSPGQIALKVDKTPKLYDLSLQDESLVFSQSANEGAPDCGAGNTFAIQLSGNFQSFMKEKTAEDVAAQLAGSSEFSTLASSQQLVLQYDGQTKIAKIVDGLSIEGLNTTEWVFSTSQPLGNTFNQGVTLVRGADSNRIVMIANDYLAKAVFGPFNSPDAHPAKDP